MSLHRIWSSCLQGELSCFQNYLHYYDFRLVYDNNSEIWAKKAPVPEQSVPEQSNKILSYLNLSSKDHRWLTVLINTLDFQNVYLIGK